MSETDGMNIDEWRKYLHKMWGKYRNATKAEKGQMLDDMEHVTGMRKPINIIRMRAVIISR